MGVLKDSAFKGKLLSEAASFIRKLAGETVVIKCGGSGLTDISQIKTLAQDIVLLKSCGIDVVLVHGAGCHVDQIFKKIGVDYEFVDGTAVTNKDNLELIEMILSGNINKQLVLEIGKAGGVAVGLSGKDGSMITARKMRKTAKETDSNIERIVDFGYLGVPFKINIDVLQLMHESPIIPVISPVGFDENYNTYVMNADDVASAIASALNANRLILMTEIGGLHDVNGVLIKSASRPEAETLRTSKSFSDIYLQKLDVCLNALKNGVFASHLIKVNEDHGILLELLSKDRSGTLIYNTEIALDDDSFDFDDYE